MNSVAHEQLADPWRRVLAWLLDLVLIVVTLVIGWVVWAIVLLWRGQTPGMQLLRMRVFDLTTGRQATFWKMFVREIVIGFGLAIILAPLTAGLYLLANIGLIAPMFLNEWRQEVRDLMVGTTVVDDLG